MNNLNVPIFLHVVCFYFAFYSSILVGAVGLSQYYACALCSAGVSVNSEGGGEFGQFSKFQRGVEEFSGSRGMQFYGGLVNFQNSRGMPMSSPLDNSIFQGVQNPEDTFSLILAILKSSVP